MIIFDTIRLSEGVRNNKAALMYESYYLTWFEHHYLFQASNHSQEIQLDIFRHCVGYSIWIDHMGIKSFWFQPNVV